MPSEAEENNAAALSADALVRQHARAKALDVAGRVGAGVLVIGADTVVVLDGKVYGKPADPADACRMLAALSGRTHSVWSGIAVAYRGECLTEAVETRVTFAKLTPEQIRRYAATGEPLDKAGAYAVQGIGAQFVERIDGCYSNVVGLPLHALCRLLSQAGVELP